MATAVDATDAVRRLGRLVSPLVGPVLYAEEVMLGAETLPSFVVMCQTAPPDLLAGEGALGIGIAGDRESAFAAGVGEAIERYSAACVPVDRLVFGTADEVGPLAVDPARFELFSDAQLRTPGFPAAPFTRETTVSWTPAFAVPSGAPALLPAQLVYLAGIGPPDTQIGCTTSNGLAKSA